MKCPVCGCDRRMLCSRCRDGRCSRCATVAPARTTHIQAAWRQSGMQFAAERLERAACERDMRASP